MKWFVNYQEQNRLSVADRGFSYGDGIFETLLVCNGEIQFEHYHVERLLRGVHRLSLEISTKELNFLFDFINANIQSDKSVEGVKVIVSRGEGGRGYLPSENSKPTVVVGFFDYQPDDLLCEHGAQLSLSSTPSSINRQIAGLKHLNRLENVLAKKELDKDCYEAIMQDDDGFLVECIQSNIFWIKNHVLHTPLLNRSGVQGTLRHVVINQLCETDVYIGRYTINDIIDADEVFICNSLAGLIPVFGIKGFAAYGIGDHTRYLQTKLKALA